MKHKSADFLYDFVIIGSGFGGSISAMRLAQKGYKVAIIEKGRDFADEDFPTTNWLVHKFFWMPLIKWFGPQKLSFLKGILVLHGVGVGGGSLIYANTLLRPRREVFSSPAWGLNPAKVNLADELDPYYETAEKMLGVTENPHLEEGEEALRKTALDLGVADSFHPTRVGIYFGTPDKKVPDPYFRGQGPERSGCTLCGGCMVGCRHGAKNTLSKNYLYFAKKWGADVYSMLEVDKISPLNPTGYKITTRKSGGVLRSSGPEFQSQRVIVAAGVLGTISLLLRNRDYYQTLPHISDHLGYEVKTNGESLLGMTSTLSNIDFSRGIAIGASINLDHETKMETVRYSKGSGVMSLLAVPLTGPGNILIRPLKLLINYLRHIPKYMRLRHLKDWATQSLIILVMRSNEESMRLTLSRRFWPFGRRMSSILGKNKPQSYYESAQQAGQIMAKHYDGIAQNAINEVLLATPTTAHILGGAKFGDSKKEGVINHLHEVHGYTGLYICDGSIVTGNLGVNPSLTISALSERFAAQFPPHPELGREEMLKREINFNS